MKDLKQQLKRAWHFLWYEESWQAWLVNVVVAFVLIKFVIYPLAGALLGTSLPVVAVVSGSMQHDAQQGIMCGEHVEEQTSWWEACGEFYEQRGITQNTFAQYPFSDGFRKGDIMVVRGADPAQVEPGDVLVYQANKQYPIIHRVIDVREENGAVKYTTKGDHNPAPISEYALANGNHYYRCYRASGGTYVGAPCGIGEPVTAQTPGALAILDETNISEQQVIGRAAARIPWLGYVKIWFVELLSSFA